MSVLYGAADEVPASPQHETVFVDRNEETGNWDLGMPCLQEEGCWRSLRSHVRLPHLLLLRTSCTAGLVNDSRCFCRC